MYHVSHACVSRAIKKKKTWQLRGIFVTAYIGSLSKFRLSYLNGMKSSLKVQILQPHSQAHVWIKQKNPCEQYVEPLRWCLVLQCYSEIKKDGVMCMKKEEKTQESLLIQRMAWPSVWRSAHGKIIWLLHPDPTFPSNPQAICGIVTAFASRQLEKKLNWRRGSKFNQQITMVPLSPQFSYFGGSEILIPFNCEPNWKKSNLRIDKVQ